MECRSFGPASTMSPFRLCSRCLQSLNSSNKRLISPLNGTTFELAVKGRGSPTRQMSWLPRVFGSKPSTPSTSTEQPGTPVPRSSPPQRRAEQVLTKALQESVDKRRSEEAAGREKIKQQLIAWGESDPIDISSPKSFQDPLGHLTFPEQLQYLANPPPAYLQTLEERAAKREEFEQTLYLADPINYWHLCFETKPDFGGDTVPAWKPWTSDHRMNVMEKFRRYDERYQRTIQRIYEKFDRPEYRSELRKGIFRRMRKTNQRNQIAAAKKNKTTEEQEAILKIEDPPLSVVDVKTYRLAISFRNSALKKAQSKFIDELVIFDDISEKGVTATEERERAQEKIALEKREEEKKQKEALEEWTNMPSEVKVESVNWGAIHSEA